MATEEQTQAQLQERSAKIDAAQPEAMGGQAVIMCPRCHQEIKPNESTEVNALFQNSRTHGLQQCFDNVAGVNAKLHEAVIGKAASPEAKAITKEEAAGMTPEQYSAELKKREAEAEKKVKESIVLQGGGGGIGAASQGQAAYGTSGHIEYEADEPDDKKKSKK